MTTPWKMKGLIMAKDSNFVPKACESDERPRENFFSVWRTFFSMGEDDGCV
ncbi:hypothetical protein COLO4_07181 [Corchorus olitorius]|uniref:Uncharacterized protein n=1 Tax=Corchorus olitorius TaxID=93759 RepID=A0A1R3KKW0_9ROSI|nr:hypothetical protein COLO4_07181 [Corchorus olitorius]